MCVTNHSMKTVYSIYINLYILISTCKFQHFNCRTAAFLAGLSTFLSRPNTAFSATQVLSCAHAVEPTFFTTVHSFQGGSIAFKKHTPLFTKVPVYILQRFIFSFFTNTIPKYRLCFRNTTFFTKVLLYCLFTH